ncbi:metallophosphoesterase family protein [Pseudomonas sp. GL-B-26]|uniref:metallophosphoesterase family protein n=1 Tax=Pseudomonas sp. GL-B-26 TaxID=2832394 RepID=UPI001CBFBE2A|nr:metallophosphoesterase [Pseudomonas sp. GL-B-26]
MSGILKWLHLSDFHFGKNAYEQEFSSRKLIDFLLTQREKGETPDFIFITGDIANSGTKEQYQLYKDNILNPLLNLYGQDFLNRIFTVPGNHDLDREVNDGFSKQKFLRQDAEYFLPTAKALKARDMLLGRFQAYIEHAGDKRAISFREEGGTYNETHSFDKLSVGIVGINTSWLCDGDQDKFYITPGYRLVREALEKVTSTDVKIVLGHHPLSWLHESERRALETVLGEHNSFYLHGHMHDAWAEPTLSGSGNFIGIQTGAGWQAPEGSKWKNGFLWTEFDLNEMSIYLRPYTWSVPTQCWFQNMEPFHSSQITSRGAKFNAPAPKLISYTSRPKKKPLGGWEVKNSAELAPRPALDLEEAIRYFDGADPTWENVLSESIPKREIVAQIRDHFLRTIKTSEVSVTVILGAGCEGKTTALLQAVSDILALQPSKRVLNRTNPNRAFIPDQLLPELSEHDDWLVVVDQAEEVSREILSFIDRGCEGYSGRIDFILASRDSDWRSSGADSLLWDYHAKFKAIHLKNLSSKDAEEIVCAWAKYGVRGLGEELYLLPASERSRKLRYYAKKEAQGKNDAFFGALLMSRHSADLIDHAEAMLLNLDRIALDAGHTLKDAFSYIAVMHAQGFDQLSSATLASVLGIDPNKLNSSVIKKLGQEAAVAYTAKAIFTRHRYIAEAVVNVLEARFDENISEYFVKLAISETRRAKTENFLSSNFWRYEISEELFDAGEPQLGLTVAQSLYDDNPNDYHLLTKLAYLYRKADSVEKCLPLFREFPEKPQNRGFYFEWGVCEGRERNYVEQALLASYAMSDDVENSSIRFDQASMFLSNLAYAYRKLFAEFVDMKFQAAHEAAVSLLVILQKRDKEISSNALISEFLKLVDRKRATLYERSVAVQHLVDAAALLPKYGVRPEVSEKVSMSILSLHSLDVIVGNVQRQLETA